METTSSLFRSVSRRVWSPPQRPFRVCSWNREVKKGITAGTLEELKEKAAQALFISAELILVCEEDGTEVDSDEFLIALPDNAIFMALKPGDIWKPHPLLQRGGNKPGDSKPRTGKDIAQITFDLYRTHPKDVFGSLNVKATFKGLYSVSADFQCLGPKSSEGGPQSHVHSPSCCWTLADLICFCNSPYYPRGRFSSSPTCPTCRVLGITGEMYNLKDMNPTSLRM